MDVRGGFTPTSTSTVSLMSSPLSELSSAASPCPDWMVPAELRSPGSNTNSRHSVAASVGRNESDGSPLSSPAALLLRRADDRHGGTPAAAAAAAAAAAPSPQASDLIRTMRSELQILRAERNDMVNELTQLKAEAREAAAVSLSREDIERELKVVDERHRVALALAASNGHRDRRRSAGVVRLHAVTASSPRLRRLARAFRRLQACAAAVTHADNVKRLQRDKARAEEASALAAVFWGAKVSRSGLLNTAFSSWRSACARSALVTARRNSCAKIDKAVWRHRATCTRLVAVRVRRVWVGAAFRAWARSTAAAAAAAQRDVARRETERTNGLVDEADRASKEAERTSMEWSTRAGKEAQRCTELTTNCAALSETLAKTHAQLEERTNGERAAVERAETAERQRDDSERERSRVQQVCDSLPGKIGAFQSETNLAKAQLGLERLNTLLCCRSALAMIWAEAEAARGFRLLSCFAGTSAASVDVSVAFRRWEVYARAVRWRESAELGEVSKSLQWQTEHIAALEADVAAAEENAAERAWATELLTKRLVREEDRTKGLEAELERTRAILGSSQKREADLQSDVAHLKGLVVESVETAIQSTVDSERENVDTAATTAGQLGEQQSTHWTASGKWTLPRDVSPVPFAAEDLQQPGGGEAGGGNSGGNGNDGGGEDKSEDGEEIDGYVALVAELDGWYGGGGSGTAAGDGSAVAARAVSQSLRQIFRCYSQSHGGGGDEQSDDPQQRQRRRRLMDVESWTRLCKDAALLQPPKLTMSDVQTLISCEAQGCQDQDGTRQWLLSFSEFVNVLRAIAAVLFARVAGEADGGRAAAENTATAEGVALHQLLFSHLLPLDVATRDVADEPKQQHHDTAEEGNAGKFDGSESADAPFSPDAPLNLSGDGSLLKRLENEAKAVELALRVQREATQNNAHVSTVRGRSMRINSEDAANHGGAADALAFGEDAVETLLPSPTVSPVGKSPPGSLSIPARTGFGTAADEMSTIRLPPAEPSRVVVVNRAADFAALQRECTTAVLARHSDCLQAWHGKYSHRTAVLESSTASNSRPLHRKRERKRARTGGDPPAKPSAFMDFEGFQRFARDVALCPGLVDRTTLSSIFTSCAAHGAAARDNASPETSATATSWNAERLSPLTFGSFSLALGLCALDAYARCGAWTPREKTATLLCELKRPQSPALRWPSPPPARPMYLGSDTEELLWHIFEYYCSFGNRANAGAAASLSNKQFAKFARDFGLAGGSFMSTQIDLIFQKVMLGTLSKAAHSATVSVSKMRMFFDDFCEALASVARLQDKEHTADVERADLVRRVAVQLLQSPS